MQAIIPYNSAIYSIYKNTLEVIDIPIGIHLTHILGALLLNYRQNFLSPDLENYDVFLVYKGEAVMKLFSVVAISALALSFNVSADVSDQKTNSADTDTDKAAMYIPPVDDVEIGAAILGDSLSSGLKSQQAENSDRFIPPEDDIEIGAAIFQ